MTQGLLARKLGMTQIFDKEGNIIPVTVVEAGPCTVLELKKDPSKIKIGFGDIKDKSINQPKTGYFKKLGVTPRRHIREFAISGNEEYKIGDEIKADFFKAGEYVDVSGTSIGKGFQGGMKRWHWMGGKASRGSMHHRRIGSNGASAFPSETLKGHNMPGHMGAKRITTQGLRVMEVDLENNILLIKGSVPGSKNGIIEIRRSFKKAFKALDEQKEVTKHKVNPMKQSKAKAGAAAKKKK